MSSSSPAHRAAARSGPVFVLGGTGWVGRHVSDSFRCDYSDVVAVSRSADSRMTASRFIPLDLVEAPIAEIVELIEAERPWAIINAAGRPWGTSEDVMRSSLYSLTQRVVVALGELSYRPRYVQVGTVMEYGPTRRGQAITERTEPTPASPYGRIKLNASETVLAASGPGGWLDAVVVRLVNVAGPGTAPTSLLGRVIENLVSAHHRGEPAELRLTPLTAERDFLDIRDAADAIRAAAESDLVGRVVNIGSGRTVPVRWLVDELIELSAVPAELIEDTGGPASPGAGGDWMAVDPAVARTELHWQPRRTLTTALRDDWDERCREALAVIG